MVLPIMVSVLADVPRMPFSLTRLIAEAKQRARQRRLLLAIAVAVVLAVTVVAAEVVTRSPAAAVSRSSAPGCAGKAGAAATPAASADTRFALVRRDEVRMLCLVLPPPGAQLLTREPAPMAEEAQRFFGFPKPFAPFARHRVWRVRRSRRWSALKRLTHRPGWLADAAQRGQPTAEWVSWPDRTFRPTRACSSPCPQSEAVSDRARCA
jgi:hypothetical protein